MSELLYGRAGAGPGRDDPDFPVVGTVRYELHRALDTDRRCIKRVEVMAICVNRGEAVQWMLDHQDEWSADLDAVASPLAEPPVMGETWIRRAARVPVGTHDQRMAWAGATLGPHVAVIFHVRNGKVTYGTESIINRESITAFLAEWERP